MKYSTIYVLSIVSINLAFSYIPSVELGDGTIWSVGSIIAGCVFIFRDYAQREVGHRRILVLMAAAGVISYLMADPYVALASALAFLVSEVADWLVYTLKRGTFKSKVVTSGLVSVPLDTIVFLFVIDHLSAFSFAVMTTSKFLALAFIAKRNVS